MIHPKKGDTMMRALALAALLAVGACNASGRVDHGGTGGGGSGGNGISTGTGGDGNPTQAGAGCGKMDLLFVVDNSGSMSEEQASLAVNFPKFIDVLKAYKTASGLPLDYRVGLTTTSLTDTVPIPLPIPLPIPQGDDGALRNKSSCGMTRPWIEGTDANPAMQFACVANVGTDGSGHEQPLNGAQLALIDRVADGKNAGFLRTDALLGIVLITDEDDQSGDPKNSSSNPLPVDEFIKAFDTVKGDHLKWATAVIAGPSACMSAFGSAEEAVRLKDFVQKSGKQAVFASICDGDLAKSLDQALKTFSQACDSYPPIQ